jgi:abhydrolase domain-containing protein 17
MIYFHANAEDIGLTYETINFIGHKLSMHVLSVEYPGYGLYKTSLPDETKMKEDADNVYDYLTQIAGVKESDIVVCGRSMGTGPASYLGSRKQPHSIALMSPYTSIRDAASSLLGSAVSIIVYERFNNLDLISKAKCPVFIVHGKQDTLIPCSHAVQLKNVCPTSCTLHLPDDM